MGLNTAVCCFFIEFVGRCLGQVGFMTQKLAIRDQEKKEKGKAVEGVDNVNASGHYLRCKWVFGFSLVLLCAAMQSAMLPFIDLTLVACNCATAIVANMLLSVFVLGEPFVWQYDATAILLIVAGTLTIALQSNTEQRNFSGEEIKQLLLSLQTMVYVGLCVVLFVADRFVLRGALAQLRKFESDAQAYDQRPRDSPRGDQTFSGLKQALSGLSASSEADRPSRASVTSLSIRILPALSASSPRSTSI